MAYGVTTRMHLVSEPLVRGPVPQSGGRWLQLQPAERLKLIERALQPAA